ncbi:MULTISPECIES: HK97-gp10 family putative phage morphogenesis protein [Burkholderia]|uniref:HK97-gp10 family putative phage morphogenesis protein n=1 Tax=Burkholderia TaxID=32008 RepID=UPI001E64FA55|nr:MULTISPECIES: HK97-gp10 family putative phage morphogenesis protein [Burkholderia]
MALKMEVQNPNGFSDLIRRMGAALGESAIRKAAASAASVVLREAEVRAPVGPLPHHQGSQKFPVGFGRDALLVTFNPEKSVEGKHATYTVTWSKDAYYLAFYEYGTSKQAARPFFRPAIDATKGAQLAAIRTSLAQSLREAGLA